MYGRCSRYRYISSSYSSTGAVSTVHSVYAPGAHGMTSKGEEDEWKVEKKWQKDGTVLLLLLLRKRTRDGRDRSAVLHAQLRAHRLVTESPLKKRVGVDCLC